MFNTLLPRVRSLASGDAVGNVPNKRNVLAFAGLSDCEIGVAAEDRLHFDEIDAMLNERVNVFRSFFRIRNHKRRLKRWRTAVKVRPRKKDLWANALAFLYFLTKWYQRFQIAA